MLHPESRIKHTLFSSLPRTLGNADLSPLIQLTSGECPLPIDLNRVRAGVVSHPREWKDGGYLELREPRERFGVIDFERLLSLLEFSTYEEFRVQYAKWVAEALDERLSKKDEIWSRSIAVGGKEFVESVKGRLGVDALYRDVADEGGMFCLRDLDVGYCEKVENS